MAAPRILVLFASAHGQTRALAEALATRLFELGAEVATYDVEAGLVPAPIGYDVVGFGSRVHGGEHAPAIIRYIDQHRSELRAHHSFFFSVSLDPGADHIQGTIQATAWRPELCTEITAERRLDPLVRLWNKVRHRSRVVPVGMIGRQKTRDFADAIIARSREALYPVYGQHHVAHQLET